MWRGEVGGGPPGVQATLCFPHEELGSRLTGVVCLQGWARAEGVGVCEVPEAMAGKKGGNDTPSIKSGGRGCFGIE